MEKSFTLHNKTYTVIKLLGHGKGGYSYLVSNNDKFYVLKKIHHEPCAYYCFGNKIEAENNDYQRLLKAGINIPKMLDISFKDEIIIKEYIEGKTIFEMIKNNESVEKYLGLVEKMAELAQKSNLNIDYFPTNFVVRNEELFYIDYECNNYMEEWNFANWGKKYWSRTKEFEEYLKNLK